MINSIYGRLAIFLSWLLVIILPIISLFTAPHTPIRIDLLTAWRFAVTVLFIAAGQFLIPNAWHWIKTGKL